MTTTRLTILMAAAACWGIPLTAANILTNGGFEQPVVSGFGNFASVPGWTVCCVSDPSLQIQSVYAAYEGTQYAQMDGFRNPLVVQSVNTIPGQLYRVTFSTSPQPGASQNTLSFVLVVDGNPLINQTYTALPTGTSAWTLHSFDVTGGSTLSVNFRELGPLDGLGMLLDAVSAEPVPEPGSLVLVLGGALSLWFVKVRKRAQADPRE